jgi:hypothetical protein
MREHGDSRSLAASKKLDFESLVIAVVVCSQRTIGDAGSASSQLSLKDTRCVHVWPIDLSHFTGVYRACKSDDIGKPRWDGAFQSACVSAAESGLSAAAE